MFKKSVIGLASLGLIAAFAAPAFAQSATPPTIACVGTAVNTRETAIDKAMTAFTGAMNAAYAARATALQSAYGLTTASTAKAAVKTAWSTFNASAKTARKAWLASRNAAWAAYRTTAVACKAPAGVGDGANSGSEASGN